MTGTELVQINVVSELEGVSIPNGQAVSEEPRGLWPKKTGSLGIVVFAHSYNYKSFNSLLRGDVDREHTIRHSVKTDAAGYQPVEIDFESYRLDEAEEVRLPEAINVNLLPSAEVR